MQEALAALGNPVIHVDGMFIDEENQCIADDLYAKFKPTEPFLGFEPTGPGADPQGTQMATPGGNSELDLVSEYPIPTTNKLSAKELEANYRAYIETINSRRAETDLVKFVQPEVTFNNSLRTFGEYLSVLNMSQVAIPDLQLRIDVLVVHEETQRIAVQLLFSETPATEYAGLAAGRAVEFPEHYIYQLVDGKIQRAWSVIDMDSAREQSAE
ncbi:hypothetical protein DL769_003013 [Monosporascus sp. CRB-8-3]|nr:hypothetical protein DL769_003013 [Monosporascus sp. CRB-8-3]